MGRGASRPWDARLGCAEGDRRAERTPRACRALVARASGPLAAAITLDPPRTQNLVRKALAFGSTLSDPVPKSMLALAVRQRSAAPHSLPKRNAVCS